MSTAVRDQVDRDAYIGNAVGICFWLFLVNVVTISCNPAWQHICCKSKLKCWRHIKTWPPSWLGGRTANKDEEEGAAADGAKEDALHDTSFWGWHGLNGRHITDGLLGQWGMLLLRTLEVILFLFTVIFQAAAPAHVATNDYKGLRPGWLSFLTNWTFLLFGTQAALGLALVIVELCRRSPCLRDTSLFSSSPDDADKAPRDHVQQLPFPTPPDPTPDSMTATDGVGTRPPPQQAIIDGSCFVTPASKPHQSYIKEVLGNGSYPVRHSAVPPPPNAPGTPAPSAPPALLPEGTPPSSSAPSPSALAPHAGNFNTPSAAPRCTPAMTHTHHVTTAQAPHMCQAARPSTTCKNPIAEAAACFALPPPVPPAAPFPPPPPAPAIIPKEAVELNETCRFKKESAGEHGDHGDLYIMLWQPKGTGCRRWWEPFMPSTDDSLPPRPLNFFEKTYLLLYQTTFVASLTITIFFWSALSGSDVRATHVLKHGAHAFAMLLDVSLSRMPAVAFHIIVAFWYAVLYSIFMFIYQIEMWRYQLVRWDDRLSPLAYVVLFLVVVLLYMVMFGIVHLRERLIFITKRYLAQPAR